MFLWAQKGRQTMAKALPWLNISVIWEGKYLVEAMSTFPKYLIQVVGS